MEQKGDKARQGQDGSLWWKKQEDKVWSRYSEASGGALSSRLCQFCPCTSMGLTRWAGMKGGKSKASAYQV